MQKFSTVEQIKKINEFVSEKTPIFPLISQENITTNPIQNYLLEKNDITNFIQKRNPNTNKFDYGKIVIIAGNADMAGAAALSANAAIKSGAGIVELFSPKIHPLVLPEIIAKNLSKTNVGTIHSENFDYLNSKCKNADSIVFGPGIGRNIETLSMLKKLILENLNQKIVIDSDVLSTFNSDDILSKNVVLTPHSGEFERLINAKTTVNKYSKSEIEQKKIELLAQTAKKMQCTILLKGSITIISDGNDFYWNIFGNSGMATAGSGDVLTGIIAAILAKKNISPLKINKKINDAEDNNISAENQNNFTQKVAIASLIHSLAGDDYAAKFGLETLTASDLIAHIKFVLK